MKIYLFIILLLSQSVHAIRTKSQTCTNLIKIISEVHRGVGSRKKTAEALHYLQNFKNQVILPELNSASEVQINPSLKNIDVSSSQKIKAQLKSAERIEGILKFFEMNFKGEEKKDQWDKDDKILQAMTLQGEEITEFLEEVELANSRSSRAHDYKLYNLLSIREDGVRRFNIEFIPNLIGFYMLYHYGVGSLNDPSFAQFSSAVIPFILLSQINGFSALKEFIFFMDIRHVYDQFLRKIQSAYKKNEKGYWRHVSFDMDLVNLNIENIVRKGTKEVDMDAYNRLSLFFKNYAHNHHGDRKDFELRWVGVDLLFYYDERYELPILTTVLRAQRKKPTFPKADPKKSKDEEEEVFIPGSMPVFH